MNPVILVTQCLDGSYTVEVKGVEYTLCGGMLLSTALRYIARLISIHNAKLCDSCYLLYNQMVFTKARQQLDLALSYI